MRQGYELNLELCRPSELENIVNLDLQSSNVVIGKSLRVFSEQQGKASGSISSNQ